MDRDHCFLCRSSHRSDCSWLHCPPTFSRWPELSLPSNCCQTERTRPLNHPVPPVLHATHWTRFPQSLHCRHSSSVTRVWRRQGRGNAVDRSTYAGAFWRISLAVHPTRNSSPFSPLLPYKKTKNQLNFLTHLKNKSHFQNQNFIFLSFRIIFYVENFV